MGFPSNASLRSLFALLPLCLLVACKGSAPTGPALDPTNQAAWGDRTAQVPGLVRELRFLDVPLPGGTHAKLDTLITRPAVEGPVPLILLVHHRPSNPAKLMRTDEK
jgi:hypothetical protein